MKNKKLKCELCDEDIGTEKEIEDGVIPTYTTIDGKTACEGCYQQELEYHSTLFCFGGDEVKELTITKNFGYFDEDGESFDSLPLPIKNEKWVNSDGWRGYTEWVLEDGYIKITDGWITGYPEETTRRKAELGEYFEELKNEKIKPPVPIYWIFGLTSNIFSQASCIVIKEKDQDAIEKWLLEINGGLDEFSKKFD